MDVRLHFDHRVLDGMPAARALAELEDALRTGIVAELNAMADAEAIVPGGNARITFRPPDVVVR